MVNKIFPNRTRRGLVYLIALTGLLLLILSGIMYMINRDWNFYTQIGAGIGLTLLLGAALLRPDTVRTFLAGRPVKYASHAIVKSVALLGILVLVNFLATQYSWEIDFTETGQFTLSPETIRFLQQLDRPVEVIGFFQPGDPRLRVAEDYLARYSQHTDLITYEFYDPNLNPKLASHYGVRTYGLVFISGSNRHEEPVIAEQTITQALARVTNIKDVVVPVPPHKPANRQIWLTPLQKTVTVFTTLIIIPVVVLMAGAIVWWKRR